MTASFQPPTPGTRIGERWELLEHLGAGAMGDVWRARHLSLGHEVAVKLMKPEVSGNRELVQRFAREARIAAQLRHRHIARVEDFGAPPDGAPWLVMELLRGESLEALYERLGRLDRDTVATVARHVGAACDVAHAAGIVHRDLKPANCFVVREEDGSSQVKVLDFGVAKAADGLKLTGHGVQLLGTPVYMSPEQTLGPSAIDGRSDLWSLAVMLYELLTGRLPFDGDSLPALLVAINSSPIAPPRSVDPSLPAAVDAWAARALDRDRERRFQTGRELADALSAALSTPLTSTHAAPPPQSPAHHSLGHAATMAAMPSVSYPSPTYPQPYPPQSYPPQSHPPQPYPPQPTAYGQGAVTQHWHATVHAAPPAHPRGNTGLLVAVAVVATASILSGLWVFASRAPSASRGPPTVAAPVPAALPAQVVAPVVTPPVAPSPVAARAVVAPPVVRPPAVARPRPRSVGPSRQGDPSMPVFHTGAMNPPPRPSSGGTWNPDEP